MSKTRKWSRTIHRDLSYLFAGMVLIYAISGIVMNHRNSINPNYSIKVEKHVLTTSIPPKDDITKDDVKNILKNVGEEKNYTKHYFPENNKMKVFLKGGSNVMLDLETKEMTYEKLSRRHIIGSLTKLHYNPGKWWRYFADAFGVCLIIITITGLIMVKGPKGIWGRGGIELLIGIAIPLIFLLIL